MSKILPITLSTFLLSGELGAPKRPQKGLWSAFFDRFSATMGRIRRLHPIMAISTFFAMRSLLLHCTARETDGGTNDRVIDPFAPFEGLAIVRNEDDRSSCSIGVLMAFDDGAAQTHFLGALGHLTRQIIKT